MVLSVVNLQEAYAKALQVDRAALREGVWRKPWGHGLQDGVLPVGRGMSQIGG